MFKVLPLMPSDKCPNLYTDKSRLHTWTVNVKVAFELVGLLFRIQDDLGLYLNATTLKDMFAVLVSPSSKMQR